MNEKSNPLMFQVANAPGEAMELVGRLFDVAKPDTVYTKPLNVEDRTIITASEIVVTMGAGYGGGGWKSWFTKPKASDKNKPAWGQTYY